MGAELKFIGENIRFLRRSKNLTLIQLASKIGIQEGPLGRIERGLNLPSASVIYQLTKVLGVTADAIFSSDISRVQAGSRAGAFFVALPSRLTSLPKNIISACNEIMAGFHALEDICGAQKHAYLPLSLSFEPDYEGMDHLASRVRNYLGIGDAVVFDYFELFENFGLRIILFSFQRAAKDLDSLSFYEPAIHNAFFFLNSRKNPEKQLFSLCFELGKILIFNELRMASGPLFPVSHEEHPGQRLINYERAAKRFSASFLMPEQAVRKTIGQLGVARDNWSWDLLLRIKNRFGVSTEAFLYRLTELGLISDHLSQKFKIRITSFYDQTNFSEPDHSKRCLNPNGRFFDLLLTAKGIESARSEIQEIEKMIQEKKIVQT